MIHNYYTMGVHEARSRILIRRCMRQDPGSKEPAITGKKHPRNIGTPIKERSTRLSETCTGA